MTCVWNKVTRLVSAVKSKTVRNCYLKVNHYDHTNMNAVGLSLVCDAVLALPVLFSCRYMMTEGSSDV
jgi:hypothetical protein